jgi:hypothetical protein
VTAVLALKEIKVLRETGESVQSVAEHMIEKYGMSQKVLKTCTDRAAVNVYAFREELVSGRCVWIPCAAHFLNLTLSCFYDHASDTIDPILDMASSLCKQDPFDTYLQEHRYNFVRPPFCSRIRWYRVPPTHEHLGAQCVIRNSINVKSFFTSRTLR